jgi:pyrroloquinoline-quinone synthase
VSASNEREARDASERSEPLSAPAFEAALREIGAERYHDKHPFNLRMHRGTLAPDAVRTWVRNRYYYQTRIPIKDGMILSKSPEADFRREWVQRIHDHDGREPGQGGLELWLTLSEAVGLDREEVASCRDVLPGVRRACDAYVAFVESHDLLESVASSLTELFAGDIMHVRIAAFEKHYSWVAPEGLAYFRSRTVQAPRDANWGLAFVLEQATSCRDQQRCLEALERKCAILWSLLDAVDLAGSRLRLVSHADLRTPTRDGDAATVVLPERAVELTGTGPEILALCDGTRTGQDIASELAARHAAHGGDSAEDDAQDFLASMRRLGVIELVPDEGQPT